MLDHIVRSFYRSPFELETGLFFSQTGPYFSVQTVVPILWTVQSGLFQRSTNKATVWTGLDRGQSIIYHRITNNHDRRADGNRRKNRDRRTNYDKSVGSGIDGYKKS